MSQILPKSAADEITPEQVYQDCIFHNVMDSIRLYREHDVVDEIVNKKLAKLNANGLVGLIPSHNVFMVNVH
jgi:hypothetical protein